jgi:hypothetical protein
LNHLSEEEKKYGYDEQNEKRVLKHHQSYGVDG